jgi:virulence-associated protein VapD
MIVFVNIVTLKFRTNTAASIDKWTEVCYNVARFEEQAAREETQMEQQWQDSPRVLEEYRFLWQDGGVVAVQLQQLFGAYQVVDGAEQVCWLDDVAEARRQYCERLQQRRVEWLNGRSRTEQRHT